MEHTYLCDINETNYRVQNNCVNYWHHVLYGSEGSNHIFFAIRIRHPQVSGRRFTDTRVVLLVLRARHCDHVSSPQDSVLLHASVSSRYLKNCLAHFFF